MWGGDPEPIRCTEPARKVLLFAGNSPPPLMATLGHIVDSNHGTRTPARYG